MAPSLKLRICATLTALLAGAQAAADTWLADQHSGTLRFVATQAGARFSGHFSEFSVWLDLDPEDPASARLDVTITMKSADTADVDRDEVLHGRDFFWVERFPDAAYHAVGLQHDGKAWIAAGSLSLRGVTQVVAVRFELEPKQEMFIMKGGATLRRLEFGVGQGEWAATTWVGDPVDVAFDLKLLPVTAATSP